MAGRQLTAWTARGLGAGLGLAVAIAAGMPLETAAPATDPPLSQSATVSPDNELPPEVSGLLREGQVVLASPGRWTGSEPFSFRNRWERCDSQRCSPVADHTGFLYRLVPEDVGKRMRAVVTASNRAGSRTALGLQSALVKGRLKPIEPFPTVAIRGYVTRRGTLLTRLAARAPAGSTMRLKCRGDGCPFRAARFAFRRHFVAVKALRGRTMGNDSVIELRVVKGDTIGKYSRFRFRRGRRPARIDRCVSPDDPSPIRCPRDTD